MMQPNAAAEVRVETNTAQDVEIHVNGKRFVADLGFMNRFAACAECDATKQWNYFYES